MRKRKIILFGFILVISKLVVAQADDAVQQYIATYKELAIEEMTRTGMPASITLAQGIHETEAGGSDLVRKSNNHFGIKCKSGWNGESVTHDDDARGECFRKYNSAEDSYRDHSDFLKNSPRYAALFNLDPTNYQDWAWGLKKAGYATNPKYPQILIKLIEDYNLNDYTLIALGHLKDDNRDIAKSKTPPGVYSSPAGTNENDEEAGSRLKSRVRDYPEGLFKINETKVIFAKEGTAWLTIADHFNIPLARLFEFNDMEQQDIVNEDQLVFLQRKRKTGNNEFHIVQEGETLLDIAQSEAIRLESLLEYNQLNNDQQPAAGEKLFLQRKAANAPRATMKRNKNSFDNRSAINNQ